MSAGSKGLLHEVKEHYEGCYRSHGATPGGVDWNSSESQALRFEMLLTVIDGEGSILDYGCGYGAMLEHMRERGDGRPYVGVDLSELMIADARERFAGDDAASFLTLSDQRPAPAADYVIASGLFNVKGNQPRAEWARYAVELVLELDRLARRGMAFNMLTLFSDPGHMRDDLYYADPGFYLRLCRETLGRPVAVLHDYPLYEFTVRAGPKIEGVDEG